MEHCIMTTRVLMFISPWCRFPQHQRDTGELCAALKQGLVYCLRTNKSLQASYTTIHPSIKAGLYRIFCGVNRLGDSGVHTLGGVRPEWMASA